MKHKVITAVTVEAITLAEARLQCKVDSDDTSHDAVLTSLITAAREFAEHYTGVALAQVTIEEALDCFPTTLDGTICLPKPPVASITHIKYTDTAGVEQTVSSGDYALSSYGTPRRVAPTFGKYWPSTQDIPDAVRIRYVTGYAATGHSATGEFAACPKAAKAAMLLHIEIESPLNPLTPSERENMERARDALLNTVKVYG